MSGISDIIAFGFGSWSTVNKVPTMGFGIGATVAPGGIEYRLANTSPEFCVPNTSPEYRAANTSPEYRVAEV